MRIDYSEPKKSYISPPNPVRQRKESSGIPISVAVVSVVLALSIGFAGGWFLSQKAAKRSFQAATEQKSLENSPPEPAIQPAKLQSQPPANAAVSTNATPPESLPPGQQIPSGTGGTTPATVLSFYKNLPAGQKSAVLGSGVNAKDEKNKQQLQAAIPSNVAPVPESIATAPKDKVPSTPAAPKTGSAAADASAFTVQVASFPLKSEAEQSKAKLVAKGYGAYIVESNQGDKGTWYRVRIGKHMEQNSAKELAAKMGKGAMVVPDR